jgi:hypothetical protein
MDTDYLHFYFDEQAFKASRGKGGYHSPEEADQYRWNDPRRPGTEHWEKHGIEPSQVLSEKMLAREIFTKKTEKEPSGVETTRVYLCYNWKLKVEFILVLSELETTFSYYTPQYGKDDNHPQHTRRDNQYLAFSVEAFKHLRPDLAVCLESL